MHQDQWHAALEPLGEHRPAPSSFDQSKENQEYDYAFVSTAHEERPDPSKPWTQGESPDGKGEFSYTPRQPGGSSTDLDEMIDEMYNEVE
jgi:Mn-containing catalase